MSFGNEVRGSRIDDIFTDDTLVRDVGNGMLRSRLLIAAIVVLSTSGAAAHAPKTAGLISFVSEDGPSFWTLTSFAHGLRDPEAIFHFESGSLSLDVPCYRRSWAYRYQADTMMFVNPYASLSRCNGEIPEIIKAFDATIPNVKLPQIQGSMLSLLDADGRVVFVLKRLTAKGLENRKWHISFFFDGTALVPSGERFTIPFATDITFIHGSVHGSPGCGGLLGTYSLEGHRATIGAILILRGVCPPDELELSKVVLTALAGDRTVEKDDERFVLRDPQGRIQIVLTPWEKRGP